MPGRQRRLCSFWLIFCPPALGISRPAILVNPQRHPGRRQIPEPDTEATEPGAEPPSPTRFPLSGTFFTLLRSASADQLSSLILRDIPDVVQSLLGSPDLKAEDLLGLPVLPRDLCL
ncbi:hypothetical protein QBC38DRAFT_457375 [Podospora fimiseda]|uniref:Uncharacterized protein n=1 Tax=Podospora fimiseda TaxID=252190 RepID=A0AAN7BLD2_9PEZI|nr:hypothetical protein QBC38DRAFT_457375 [Podospora fimiseda]